MVGAECKDRGWRGTSHRGLNRKLSVTILDHAQGDSMRKLIIFLSILLIHCIGYAQDQPTFSEYFADKALRIELYCTGDAKSEEITVGSMVEEPVWPGNPSILVQPFERGHRKVSVYDSATNRLIYAAGYDDMLGEYQTTTPAQNGIRRTFERAIRIPPFRNGPRWLCWKRGISRISFTRS